MIRKLKLLWAWTQKKLYMLIVRNYSPYYLVKFNNELSDFVIKKLKHIRITSTHHPINVKNMTEWRNILDQIIKAFIKLSDSQNKSCTLEEYLEIQKGLELFQKYILNFW